MELEVRNGRLKAGDAYVALEEVVGAGSAELMVHASV